MVIAFTLYLLIILLAVLCLKEKKHTPQAIETRASVIVAVHNEQESLPKLLDSFLAQDHPLEHIEFIIANDRSTDRTAAILEAYKPKFPQFKIITITELPDGKFGKKNALSHAIEQATNDVLLFTDGDCFTQPNWASSTLSYYAKETGAVIGQSPARAVKSGFIPYVQEAENTFNHIISFLSTKANHPVMSFGGNFSYRKSIFQKINGFERVSHSLSGDDDLLLAEMRKIGLRVEYNTLSTIYTHTVDNLSAFIRQKTRHLSAARYFSVGYQVSASLFHIIHLLGFMAMFNGSWVMLLSLKLAFDGCLFYRMNKILKLKHLPRIIFLWEIAYLPYVFLMSINAYRKKISQIKW